MTDTGDFQMIYDAAAVSVQIGILITLGAVMLLAARGRDLYTGRIHRFAGLLCFVLALEFAVPFFFLQTTVDYFYNGIVNESIGKRLTIIRQLDSLAAYPLLAMLLFSLFQAYRPIPYWKILHPLVVPVILFVWTAVDFNADRQNLLCNAFWISYAIFLIIAFSSQIKGYIRYCKENYADISSRSIRWLIGIPVLLIPVLAFSLYAYSCQESKVTLISISEFSFLPALLYLLWYAHKQVPSMEIPEQVHEVEECDGNDAKALKSSDMFEVFSRLMEDKCKNEKIFLNPNLTRTELAKILDTNTTYVSRYFSSLGTNFNEYINDLRIEYACRLIREAEHPDTLQMKSIAIASGFCNYRTFARLFTEKHGVSPTVWCKEHRATL